MPSLAGLLFREMFILIPSFSDAESDCGKCHRRKHRLFQGHSRKQPFRCLGDVVVPVGEPIAARGRMVSGSVSTELWLTTDRSQTQVPRQGIVESEMWPPWMGGAWTFSPPGSSRWKRQLSVLEFISRPAWGGGQCDLRTLPSPICLLLTCPRTKSPPTPNSPHRL